MKIDNLIQYYNDMRRDGSPSVNSLSDNLDSARRIKLAIIDNRYYLHGINTSAKVIEMLEEDVARTTPHRTILYVKIKDDTASVTLSISVNDKSELSELKKRFDDYGEVMIRIKNAFIKPLHGEISLNLRMGSFSIDEYATSNLAIRS